MSGIKTAMTLFSGDTKVASNSRLTAHPLLPLGVPDFYFIGSDPVTYESLPITVVKDM